MMEMSLKYPALMALTVAVAVMAISDQVNISLDKMQKTTRVQSGSNLTLSCNLSFEEREIVRVVVAWFFNSSGSSFNKTHRISKKLFNISAKNSTEASTKTKQDSSWEYILSNVTYKHSGWYFCNVTQEIPTLKVIESEVTEVVVVPRSPNKSLLGEWWMWIILAVSILILIALLIICVLMKRRLCRRRAPECPIYVNTRPNPSPRPGTSACNLKTVSSTENLSTPNTGGRYEEGKRKYRQ